MKPYKVIERTPEYNDRPVCDGALTIEYHFRHLTDANSFKLPKKLKGNYALLEESIAHTKLSMKRGIGNSPAIDSYYRIAQKEI